MVAPSSRSYCTEEKKPGEKDEPLTRYEPFAYGEGDDYVVSKMKVDDNLVTAKTSILAEILQFRLGPFVKSMFPPSFYLKRWQFIHQHKMNRFWARRKGRNRKMFHMWQNFQFMLDREELDEYAYDDDDDYKQDVLEIFSLYAKRGFEQRYQVPDYIDEFVSFPEWVPWYWHLVPSRRKILFKYAVRQFLAFHKDRGEILRIKQETGFANQMSEPEALQILAAYAEVECSI
jgi:hypothetical protein